MAYSINRVENFLDPFVDDFFGINDAMSSENFGSLSMKTDIEEVKDGYNMVVDLPGIKKEDVSISLEDGYLTIKASANPSLKNEKGEKKGYKHRERFSGSASRSYYVGDIDEKKVTATFENGALKVFFPKEKEPEVTSHQIAIK